MFGEPSNLLFASPPSALETPEHASTVYAQELLDSSDVQAQEDTFTLGALLGQPSSDAIGTRSLGELAFGITSLSLL